MLSSAKHIQERGYGSAVPYLSQRPGGVKANPEEVGVLRRINEGFDRSGVLQFAESFSDIGPDNRHPLFFEAGHQNGNGPFVTYQSESPGRLSADQVIGTVLEGIQEGSKRSGVFKGA